MSNMTTEERDAFLAARSTALQKFHAKHRSTIQALCDELDAIAAGEHDDGGINQGYASPPAFAAFYAAAKAFITEVEGAERKPWDGQ